MSNNLTSIPTLVESPFIIATIGDVTFGSYSGDNSYGAAVKVTYPNFMKSMIINKVNGTVNTYTLNFSYQVRAGNDPNLLDKIFSKASKDRRIILQYGDWNAPSYIYKEEKCIITNVTSSLNMNNSSIDYTVNCTSDAIALTATPHNFPARTAKPSDVMMELLSAKKYGLNQVFTGMQNKNNVLMNNLITSNDKKVKLLPQSNVNVLSYMNYLVDSMINNNNKVTGVSDSKYYLTIHDDTRNTLGGTYFKVEEVSKNTKTINSLDTYEIDINYPGDNFVTQFTVRNDQSWAILYDFNQSVRQEEYNYSIDDDGNLVTVYSPALITSSVSNEPSAAKSSWWTNMTEFPIKGSLTIKGLTRPSILMSYVKVNVMFNGIKHTSSGLYIITKQTDTIDSSGYKTTLEVLRVGGD